MADTIAVTVAVSSDAALDKAVALAESYLKPEAAAEIRGRLKAVHLRSASLEADVDAPGAGSVRVKFGLSVTEAG